MAAKQSKTRSKNEKQTKEKSDASKAQSSKSKSKHSTMKERTPKGKDVKKKENDKIGAAKKEIQATAVPDAFSTGLEESLLKNAVSALIRHHEKTVESSKDLLGNDRPIQVQITLMRAPHSNSPKPIPVAIPHSLYKLGADGAESAANAEADVCLIVKEESKPDVQKIIKAFPDHMGCIKKVLGLQSLRNKHSQFQQRRELLHKYDLFMADDRILPMLHKPLGNDFTKAKKMPIPVSVARATSLPFAIQKALGSTYMTISSGTCINIKAGDTTMSEEHLVANIAAVAKNAAAKIPHKWANVRMVCIKTPESTALPVYNKTPEALLEIANMAGIATLLPRGEKKHRIADAGDEKNEDSTENNKEKSIEPSTKSKKKIKLKSPLLRALEKQKVEEKAKGGDKTVEKSQLESEATANDKKSKKRQEADEEIKVEDESPKNDPKVDEDKVGDQKSKKKHKVDKGDKKSKKKHKRS